MFLIDTLILVVGGMLLIGIVSSKVSARLGLPVLVLFLLLGMLAGEEGPGGIVFESYALAHGFGSVALAIILFDGGLGTPLAAVRAVWRPAVSLATMGVLLTAVVTGVAASWILEIPLLHGMLLGSIVSSTDAAAVFSVLRSGGVTLPDRLASTLEVESGSNDPMALFLTVGCIELILAKAPFGLGLMGMFVSQMFLGALLGLAIGYLAVRVINRIHLEATGLYPVLVMGFGFATYGLAATAGGSGFLAAYIAGIVIGNHRLVFNRGIRLFHDAAAWLAQIAMFTMLGLLSLPSRLLEVAPQGLLIGIVLVFVARPLAVALTVPFFRFSLAELTFMSWVGLKGAVPIILAIFPLLFDVPGALLLFDVVFFVVVLSAIVQGWTLPLVARWLKLEIPPKAASPVSLEIHSLKNVDGDVIDFAIDEGSRAAGRLVRELALPEGVVIALIVRQQQVIPPHGKTRLEAGDHVILVLRPETLPLAAQVFNARNSALDMPEKLEFPLRPTVTVRELEEAYGVRMHAPANATLDEAIRSRLGSVVPHIGTVEAFGPIALRVRAVSSDGTIEQVSLSFVPKDELFEAGRDEGPENSDADTDP